MFRSNRRYFIYGGMFILLMISYVDRINIAVAAPAIAHAYHLNPVQMGYLFSSYLWTYLLLLIPVGIGVDRWGVRRMASGSLFVWSVGGILTGLVSGFAGLLGARMVLGVGEAAGYPAGGRVIREWAPRSERGVAAAWLNGGAYAGLAFGAVVVGWIVTELGWRESFYITGGFGVVLALVWYLFYRSPDQAHWLNDDERKFIVRETSDAPELTTDQGGWRATLAILLHSKTMWGLALTQGCAGYTLYLFMTWLPTYMVTTRGLDVLHSSIFTAVPYAAAVVFGLLLGRVSDWFLRRSDGLAGGGRRKIMATCLLISSVVLLTPLVSATWLLLVLFSISLTCVSTVMAMNIALTNDLLLNGTRAGIAVSLLIFGGNSFGVLAPILTGYAVEATGSFTIAFLLAGTLLLAGTAIVLTLTRRPIDEAVELVIPKKTVVV